MKYLVIEFVLRCVVMIIQNANDNKIIQLPPHVYANLYYTYIFPVAALVVDRTTRSGSAMTRERNNNRYAMRQYVRVFWIAIDLMRIIKLHVGPEMTSFNRRHVIGSARPDILMGQKFVKINVGQVAIIAKQSVLPLWIFHFCRQDEFLILYHFDIVVISYYTWYTIWFNLYEEYFNDITDRDVKYNNLK